MKVRVELHAVLRDLLTGGAADVELSEGASVTMLLDEIGVDPEMRELVTVNNTQVLDQDATLLSDGDVVSVFPAVVGGDGSVYIDEGLKLYEEGDYFLAHETLEEFWAEAPDPDRNFLQGLIQLCVGLHHYERNNYKGTLLQFDKAAIRLTEYPPVYRGVDVDAARAFLDEARWLIENGVKLDPPQLRTAS